MREYAAVHGLFVEFRGVPGTGTGRVRSGDGAGRDMIYYGKRLPPSRQKGEKQRVWLNEDGAWAGLERRLAVPEELLGLPGEVLAASVDDSSCGIYWRESGGVEPVEQIRRVLDAWSGSLRQG